MASAELHQYIHTVLEGGDQGPHRHIMVDKDTLNDAIDQHTPRIAELIKPDVMKAMSEPDKDTARVTVKNDLGNVSFQCVVTEPANLNELVNIIAKAKRENMNVKPAGSLRAFSPICETDGYLIKSDKLTGVTRTPKGTLINPSQEGLYDVLGGTTLQTIIDALEKDGRALMNLGGFKGQGIVGATATGTHGSGLKLPPLASMIRSIHLVSAQFDATGQPIQYRIEPTAGITDPKLHTALIPLLIQNDEMFNAVVTGLGAFGVVYAVTLETVPFYWITETRQIVDWQTAKQLLAQGPNGDILKHHNAEVLINQYTGQALITRRDLVTTPPPASQLTGKNLSIFATLVQQLPALKVVTEAIKDGDVVDDISSELGATLAGFLKDFPLLLPAILNIAMNTQFHAQPKTAKYYDIYDIGLAIFFPAISTEISFPLTTNVPATDAVIAQLQKFHRQDFGKALAGFLSLRFTAPTPASASMSFSADKNSSGRCYLEIFSLFNFFDSIKGFDDILAPLTQESVNKFRGRLHWGQYITPSFTTLQYKIGDPEFFASISTFRSVAEKFDPGHLMTNDFLKELIWLQP